MICMKYSSMFTVSQNIAYFLQGQEQKEARFWATKSHLVFHSVEAPGCENPDE